MYTLFYKYMKKPQEYLSPIDKVLLSFIVLIFAGAFLLCLPICTNKTITFIDALFTSTSAVCVTGLVVLDTAKDFTFIGQVVIILLIQLGGLGIMTFSVALLSLMGGSVSIKWRFTLQNMYSEVSKLPIRNILGRIVIYTFTIESIVAIILFTQFIKTFPLPDAVWHSVFHSISAFCNAGFSTFSNNLMDYNSNSIVVISIAVDIILGGIGFLVMSELFTSRSLNINKMWKTLTLHTRIVLFTTVLLIAGGMVLFFVLEFNGILQNMSFKEKLLASFFQSVTARTAGFNTVDIGGLREATCLVLIFLMFIGGSPGSIAGGVKTSTFAILWLFLTSRLKGLRQIIVWERALAFDNVERAITLVVVSGLFIFFATFILVALPTLPTGEFLQSFFEVTSAFGTVGLSMGITPKTLPIERIILCIVMYTGRLGPLTLISALTLRRKTINIRYAEDHIMIG
ncbi:MAG: TrkH family potassium uptake protein [Spirochaetes bacterium]|nr:TrkH family potassium uptake protein [Spirochaetota bacterium]